MIPQFSIIIPSRSITNLTACVAAIRAAGETARVIVVWDGEKTQNSAFDVVAAILPYHSRRSPIDVEEGVRPFIFARNINIGIRSAGRDSVVLLNDDAILRTSHGLSALATQAQANPEYGAICPGFDHVGTPNLCSQGRRELTEERIMLVFACVFIPRSTIDRVGLLDERFGINAGGPGRRGYGCEDDDYSKRIRDVGLKLGVYDPVRVDHTKDNTGLASTFRDDPEHPWDVKAHEAVFEMKHGVHPRLQK